MSENTSLVPQDPTAGLVSSSRVNLAKIHAQMQAMQTNNMGGAAGGSYDMKGKVKIDVNKNGTLTFTNPFTGKPDGGKMLSIAVLDVKFQLQRWLGEGEEVEGIDSENQKGPLCRTVQFANPLDPTEIDETGWFYQPPMSAYHAHKMLKHTLTGSNGPNGQCGLTLCSECPYGQQGLKGNDARCKPVGMMEVVIFRVGDQPLEQPVYGVIKLSQTSIIAFNDYLEQIKKRHNVDLAQVVCTLVECLKITDKAKTYGKLQFAAVGAMTKEIMDQAEAAVIATEELMKAQAEAEDEKEAASAGGKKSAF
jgi:hypothetical protein